MNGFAKLLADLLRPLPRSAEAHPPAKKGSAEILRETNERTIARLKDMTTEGSEIALAEKRMATFAGPAVVKVPDDPARRDELLRAIKEAGRHPGKLVPGETVEAHIRDANMVNPPSGRSSGRSIAKHPLMGAPYGKKTQTVEVAGQVLTIPTGYSIRDLGDGWFEAVSPEGAMSANCPTPQEAAGLCFEHMNTALPSSGEAKVFPFRTDIEAAPRNFLIFINGDPRSGKDTTSFAIEAAFQKRGYRAEARSSIEPVRKMLQNAGFDLSAKTEKDRFLLAGVGDRVEEHSDFRSRACIEWFRTLARIGHEEKMPVALVLHTREPATMHKIAFGLRDEMSLKTKTLFVSGRGIAVTSNKADAGVRGMVYDDEIKNDGTLADLEARVDSLVGSWTS